MTVLMSLVVLQPVELAEKISFPFPSRPLHVQEILASSVANAKAACSASITIHVELATDVLVICSSDVTHVKTTSACCAGRAAQESARYNVTETRAEWGAINVARTATAWSFDCAHALHMQCAISTLNEPSPTGEQINFFSYFMDNVLACFRKTN